MAVGASEPTEVERVSPPFGRDRLAHLWIATRTMSAVTDAIWSIGLAWTAVQVGSPASAGVVVAAGTVPRAAFLLVGGEFADRFDVRRVMIWANIGRLVALAGVVVAVLSAGPAYVTLVVGAVLLGAADAIYDPAAASVARQIVHPSDIPKYTGVYQTVGRLGSLLGSALGGVVVAHWAVQGTAALNIVAFGAVLIFVIFGLKIRYPLEKSSHNSVLEGLVGTFDHLRSQPVTRALVLSQMFINVFIAPCLGLGIVVRVDELGFGAEYVGYVGVVVGIGAVLGALWTVRFNVGRPGLIGYVLFAVEGLAIVGLGLGDMEMLFVGGFVMGVCAGAASSMLGAVFMTEVRGEYIGRMLAFSQLGDEVLLPLSTVLFGVVAAAVSPTLGFSIFGGAMFLVMCLPLRNAVIRQLRNT